MKEYIITKKEEGLTVYKFSLKVLSKAPSGMIRKFLRNKNIELNRKRTDGSDRLKAGDSVCFFLSAETYGKFSGSSGSEEPAGKKTVLPLDKKRIIYEDGDFLFYDKPAGILSQSDSSNETSINDSLLKYISDRGPVKPSICNRLDRNTSGLIMCGKTYEGLKTLDSAIKDRQIKKYYLCILEGRLSQSGRIRAYLRKDPAKNKVDVKWEKEPGYDEIINEYRLIKTSSEFTFAEVLLVTGKPHQIRAMSALLNAPLVGDIKYGNKKTLAKRPLLHSYRVEFPDTILEGGSFTAPVPEDMKNFLDDKSWLHGIPED